MNAPVDHSAELTDRILGDLRAKFYAGADKVYFQDLKWLRKGICMPARYLEKRSLLLPAARYEELLQQIVAGIVNHAGRDDIRRFGPYFLHCVQKHMLHHGEEYCREAKTFSKVLDHVMLGLLNTKAAQHDKTTESLAATHKVLDLKSGRKKKQAAGEQIELFSDLAKRGG